MKNLDMFISTAVSFNLPSGAITILELPPPDAIEAAEAEARLRRQQCLIGNGERGNLHQIRVRARPGTYFERVMTNSTAVGLMVSEVELRRVGSQLPRQADCIEANVQHYGANAALDPRDMLYLEAQWTNASATCFLVDRDRVMTARHVFDESGAGDALRNGTLRVVFDFAFTRNNRPCDVFCKGSSLFEVEAMPDIPPTESGDWIVLRLKGCPAADGSRVPVTIASEPLASATPLYTLGHPKRVSMRYASTSLAVELAPEQQKDKFRAYLDAYRGSSGSPVFSADSHKLVGMVCSSILGGGVVQVRGEFPIRAISLLSLPDYAEKATLCLNSAAFAGKF